MMFGAGRRHRRFSQVVLARVTGYLILKGQPTMVKELPQTTRRCARSVVGQDAAFPLDQVNQALEAIKQRPGGFTNIVANPGR